MRCITVISLVLLFLGVAAAQPVITDGPLNAASVNFSRPGEPNSGIAQGSMLIVKGNGLGTCGISVASTFPLKTTIGTTSIKITMAGNTYNVLMYYVVACQQNFPDQLAGVVPSNTPVGNGTITVTYANRTSAAAPIVITQRRFGIYTENGNGTGRAVIQNFNSATDQPVNSLVESSHPGQSEILWGDGLGPITGDDSQPPTGVDLQNMNISVDVFVGNQPASVAFKGRTIYPSVDVIVFTVPNGVQGCYVPVAVRVAGVLSNVGTISVTPSGKVCSDPAGFSTGDLQKVLNGGSLTVADLGLFRLSAKLSLTGLGNFQGNIDFADGRFNRYVTQTDLLNSVKRGSIGALGEFPSAGCQVVPFTFQDFFSSILTGVDIDPVNIQKLDAGPALNVSGPIGAKQVPRKSVGGGDFKYEPNNGGILAGGIPGLPGFPPQTPDYLQPGAYTLDNGAGAVVGPFSTGFTIPGNQPVWTNEDSTTSIPRSQDLTITWSGGVAGGFMAIIGDSADPSTSAGAEFACIAPADAGSFTVPSWVLAALPGSGADPATGGTPVGFLMLGTTLPQPARFQATGVDVGFVSWAALQTKNVKYQ